MEPLLPLELSAWPGYSIFPGPEGQQPAVREAAFIDDAEDWLGLRLRTLVTKRDRLTWYAGQPYGELFDLQEVPQELHNLWNQPAHQAVPN